MRKTLMFYSSQGRLFLSAGFLSKRKKKKKKKKPRTHTHTHTHTHTQMLDCKWDETVSVKAGRSVWIEAF